MHISEFDYSLPQEYIAQVPIEPRDGSRMMIVDRGGKNITDSFFYKLPGLLNKKDMLVFNDSRVIPARIFCKQKDHSTKLEVLLLRRIEPGIWECIVRPGRKIMPGDILFPVHQNGKPGVEGIDILEKKEGGLRIIHMPDESIVDSFGNVPLPPYIHTPLEQPERYQTVYSSIKGSVAAPTAGLHFTPALLEKVKMKDVKTVFVTLHIGLDTFRPIREEDPLKHPIHTEFGEISSHAAERINEAKKAGGRIIAVGTSTVRLLEAASRNGMIHPWSDQVKTFITPGFSFQITDAMITNFHLPRSTLILLVSAFAGKDLIFGADAQAIQKKYRFYSFGDCMFIR